MAGTSSDRVRLFRFGPFELDVRARELRKNGIRIKLREQPARILLMLLDSPGEVVLREEIRRRLWPNDTIVEFGHGINAAIQKLRDALGESADKPRYVETVARRGYRFIGEVERICDPPPEPKEHPEASANGGELSGRTVAHYRILNKLGEGGMGQVYRASDSKLGRDVAVKFLSAEYADDPGWRARFEREARVLARLNHPNIAAIYALEDRALVMELVAGQMLPGPLPLKTALLYAEQIAGALEVAHEKGVVHRDLKPGNIMVRPDGVVKVLDFGLAKSVEGPATDKEDSPTLTSPAHVGRILGTAAYMSPEQTTGKQVDKRTDIWAFGVVFWEVLTGRRLFGGDTVTQTLAAVLHQPIELDRLPEETPASIRHLLARCLDRDASTRLRDIGEARIAIRASLSESPESISERPPAIRRGQWLPWSAAAILALALCAFLYLRDRQPAGAADPIRIAILADKDVIYPTLSPDGRKLAFLLNRTLGVQSLESGEFRDLGVTSNGLPLWSPDSRWIVYFDKSQIRRIEATGGPSQEIANGFPDWGGGTWSKDGVIVFASGGHLFRIPVTGGNPIEIAAPVPNRETILFGPQFLPDARHFLYVRRAKDPKNSAIYLGSIEAKPEQQSLQPLVSSDAQAGFAPSPDSSAGYLLFIRAGALLAQAFDNRRLMPMGRAMPVADSIERFSVSASNVLEFDELPPYPQLAWFDRDGNVLETVGERGPYVGVTLSPTETQVAVLKDTTRSRSIWLIDLARGGAGTQFSFGSPSDSYPVWSRDGRQIIFNSNRGGHWDLYRKPADSSKEEELLLKSDEDKNPISWSADGRYLLYTVGDRKTGSQPHIWVLSLAGERKPVPFLVTPRGENYAVFSPDGKWVVYDSFETGQSEVQVRSFSVTGKGEVIAGGKIPISVGYGTAPWWRRDGRELYYQGHFGTMYAVDITTTPALRAGPPRRLGITQLQPGSWEPSADGKRFLAYKRDRQRHKIVLNWQAGLKPLPGGN